MKNSAFTIQTYFPTGNITSYRICYIPTTTIQAIFIPRETLDSALEHRPELEHNGIYFLFEKQKKHESISNTLVYIGESENIRARLTEHKIKKTNWEVAIIFTTNSSKNQLTKADLKYLENFCYQKALEANRYGLKQNTPTKSFVTEAREADLFNIYQTISELLFFLEYPIFIPLQYQYLDSTTNEPYFYMNSRGSDAKALYSEDGMIVLRGSKISDSFEPKSFKKQKLLNQLIATEVISKNGIFLKDYIFSSPSGAADLIGKGSYNGWDIWKNKNGIKLKEVFNKN